MRAITPGVKRLDGAPIDGLHQSAFEEGDECPLQRSRLGGEEGGEMLTCGPHGAARERGRKERRQAGPTAQ